MAFYKRKKKVGNMNKIKLLFVCHGNICRSPMAEFIFLNKIKKLNLESYFYVESKATSDEEIYLGRGNPIYPPVQEILTKHHIPFSKEKRACKLLKEDYDKFDYILAMDKNNLRNMLKIFNNDNEHKVKLLLEYISLNEDISDPWYTRDFERTYLDITRGIDGLIDYLITTYNLNLS